MTTPYPNPHGFSPNNIIPKVNFGWIGEAWEIYRKAWLSWLVLFLIPVASTACLMIYVYTSPQMLALFSQMQHPGVPATPGSLTPTPTYTIVSNTLSSVQYLINFIVACCASNMAVRQVRGETIEVGSIFQGMRNWVQMLVFGILFFLCTMLGALACCIGMFAVYGLLMPGYAMVADGESGTNAISRSLDGMKADWLNASMFAFVFYLILLFGSLLTCFLGAFIFYPMMFIISALAYRDMIGMPSSGGPGIYSGVSGAAPWQQYGQPGYGQQAPGVWPPAPSAGQPPQYGQPPFGQGPMGQSPFGQPPPYRGQDDPDNPPPGSP